MKTVYLLKNKLLNLMKTVLMQLAFTINAHQNANQKPIGSAPAYKAQCTLTPQPIYQTLLLNFFEGLVPRLMLLSSSWNYLRMFLVATLQGMCAYVIR